MSYLKMNDTTLGLFDPDAMETAGTELNERYNDARPYPHVCIDQFFPDEVLEMCLREFPRVVGKDGVTFDRPQERHKSSFNPDRLSSQLRSFFYSLNSRPFIRFIENLTGISGLIPDPYFLGAGFHQITNGGHLSMHADFNHHKAMDLERRINVLIYLNKDWKDQYGGQLELWDDAMTKCYQSIVPLFNRCVIFNTTSKSMHGNPRPVSHPEGVPRRSIALYYYTSTWSSTKREHTTQFKRRPDSDDKTDYRVRLREAVHDWLPPIVYRRLASVRGDRQ